MPYSSPLPVRTRSIVWFLCIALSPVIAIAQNPSPGSTPEPPPEPPFVADAATGLEWIITYSTLANNSPSDAPHKAVLKSMTVSKAGNLRREISVWSDGSQTENWQADNVFIRREPTWAPGFLVAQKTKSKRNAQRHQSSNDVSSTSLNASKADPNDDFHLGWVAAEYFKGTVNYQGKPCHVYEAPDSVVRPGEALTDDVKAKANDPSLPENLRASIRAAVALEQEKAGNLTRVLIDAKTRLPLTVEGNGETQRFTYRAGPKTLSLPPAYAKELAAFKQLYPN